MSKSSTDRFGISFVRQGKTVLNVSYSQLPKTGQFKLDWAFAVDDEDASIRDLVAAIQPKHMMCGPVQASPVITLRSVMLASLERRGLEGIEAFAQFHQPPMEVEQPPPPEIVADKRPWSTWQSSDFDDPHRFLTV